LIGGGAWLHHWLEPVIAPGAAQLPVTEVSAATEWTLLGVAVAIALAGIIGALRLLNPAALVPARQAPAETGLGAVLNRKWYVDELYDFLFVRPIQWLSRTVLWRFVDQGVVDGAGVNGTAVVSRALGWIGSKLQTGQVGVYVSLFV